MKSIFIAIMIALTVRGVPACNACVRLCEVYSTFGSQITLEDSKGNLWEVEGVSEQFAGGSKFAVLFDTKNTATIYDDEIVEIYRLEEERDYEVQC